MPRASAVRPLVVIKEVNERGVYHEKVEGGCMMREGTPRV